MYLEGASGFGGMEWWNGMVEWNGGLEWNGNKLDTSDWFSPPYRPPLNKDYLLIKTTFI